jgi:hypothetical protein
MVFIVNVKNFGLRYYSDKTITQTYIVVILISLATGFFNGLFIDKFGLCIVYRTISGVLIMTVLTFYLFMDNIWVFYLCIMLFSGLNVSLNTTVTVSTTYMYDHEVGKRLQKYMHCVFAVGGIVAIVINDNIVLQIFGEQA